MGGGGCMYVDSLMYRMITVIIMSVLLFYKSLPLQCSLLYKTAPAAKPKRSLTQGGLIWQIELVKQNWSYFNALLFLWCWCIINENTNTCNKAIPVTICGLLVVLARWSFATCQIAWQRVVSGWKSGCIRQVVICYRGCTSQGALYISLVALM